VEHLVTLPEVDVNARDEETGNTMLHILLTGSDHNVAGFFDTILKKHEGTVFFIFILNILYCFFSILLIAINTRDEEIYNTMFIVFLVLIELLRFLQQHLEPRVSLHFFTLFLNSILCIYCCF
jgi:hypothetical protein